MPRQFIDDVADVGRDDELVMIRAEVFGGDARVFEFAVAVFVKTDGESFDRLPVCRAMRPTTALESMPPERNAPSGTSEMRRTRTASSSNARSSSR
jgi:hypothetical protein